MITDPSTEQATVPMDPATKAIATALMMAATVLVVLDQTIANVALPHMQTALGASPESISWVLTSYILATAIATPLTGWLAGRFGRKRLFGVAIAGFTISSALCGVAASLPMMVAARLCQGFFGAFLMPMSQSFMYDMNARSQQIRAMTIWGIGVTVAPVVGPALGGLLTEYLNWRWVFFINVPIGALATIGIFAIIPKFPAERRGFDHFGFVLIAFALGGLQLALDRGTQQDWLNSPEIIIELGVSVSAFWMLIFHLRRHPHPLIPIQLFQNPNFVGALLLALVVAPVVVAGSALLPPFMQVLLGYPVLDSGLLVVPRGVAMALSMIVGGRLMQLLDGRLVIALGLLVIICGLWIQTWFNLEMDSSLIIWSGMLLGAGSGLSFSAVNFVAVSTLPPLLRTDGAAYYSLVRNLGTSIMITLMTALLARNTQINHAEIGSALHASSAPFLMTQMLGGSFAADRVAAIANAEVTRQAVMVAYLDDFWLMMWLSIAVIPTLFVLRPVRPVKGQRIEISE